jgi:serine protease Do
MANFRQFCKPFPAILSESFNIPSRTGVAYVVKHNFERNRTMNSTPTRLLTASLALVLLATAGTVARAAKSSSQPLPAASVAPLRALSDSFVSIAEHVKLAVVSIHSEKTIKYRREWSFPFGDEFPFRRFFEDNQAPQGRRSQPREYQFQQRGLGSGIILDKEGHILTNNHVVQDVDEIKVTLADKRSFAAKVIGTDPKTDLAVIQIKDKVPADLPVAELGDSEALRIGEWVLAFGAPFGYEQTVTAGIVSAKGRGNVGVTDYEDFIQTDAAINPGNSGGPLVNDRGQVIGINTVIASSSGQNAGVGFSIPINMAKNILPTLLKGGKVSRGMLGVIIQDIDEDLAKQFDLAETHGVLVSQVTADSPAEKAGIKVGDVVIKFNGQRVEDSRQLRNAVAGTNPGAKVEVVVIRKGKERTLKAELVELSGSKDADKDDSSDESKDSPDIGLTVVPLNAAKARELGYDKEEGVLVSEVDDGSPAARADLQSGDLITEVNREKVTRVSEFNQALAKAKGKQTVLLLVKRKDLSRFVIIRLK